MTEFVDGEDDEGRGHREPEAWSPRRREKGRCRDSLIRPSGRWGGRDVGSEVEMYRVGIGGRSAIIKISCAA